MGTLSENFGGGRGGGDAPSGSPAPEGLNGAGFSIKHLINEA